MSTSYALSALTASLALGLASLPQVPAAVRDVEQPTSRRYRIEMHRVSELEPEGGGSRIVGSVTTTAYVSLKMRDTTGGQVARFVVDTLRSVTDGAARLLAAGYADATGEHIEVVVVGGRATGEPTRSRKDLGLRELFEAVPLVFSGYRRGAGEVVDTTSLDRKSLDYATTGRRITRLSLASTGEDEATIKGEMTESYQTSNWRFKVRQDFTGSGEQTIVVAGDGNLRHATSRFQGHGKQSGNGTAYSSIVVNVWPIR